MNRLLNVAYSGIHGFYWMYYGVVYSFASVFLLSKGYTNSQIGLILAIGSLVAIVVQPIVADMADRSEKLGSIGISEILTLILILCAMSLAFVNSLKLLAGIYIAIAGLMMCLQPIFNSLSGSLSMGKVSINFGIARSIGSMAYAILMAILGFLVAHLGSSSITWTGVIVLSLLLATLVLVKKGDDKNKLQILREAKGTRALYEREKINLIDFIKRHKMFFVVNLGVLGLYSSNAVLNNFMLQIVQDVGGTSQDMGRIFSVMAFMEMPAMIFYTKIRKHFSSKTLIKVGAIFFTVKVFCCYISTGVTMIFLTNLLCQTLSFGLFLPAMVDFTGELMSRGEAVKGQALFTTMNVIASIAVSAIGGIIIDMWGAKSLLLISTISTFMGAILIMIFAGKVKKEDGKSK